MFGTRWRWNATASLAVRRMNGGRKVPPQFQRSDAEDLLTVVFPDQVACGENLVGEREIPDHPLVNQTLHDCLHETMDVDGFVRLLAAIESGEVAITTRELSAPSPLAYAILNARPYAFLDDGAAEERRTKAVSARPLVDLQTAQDIGKLDPQVIAQVREDARPEIRDAEELHDALVVHGFLTPEEAPFPEFVGALVQQRRVTRLQAAGDPFALRRGRTPARVPRGVPGRGAVARHRPTSTERPACEDACARSCAAGWKCWARSRPGRWRAAGHGRHRRAAGPVAA
jgi:ATP-dependent Lhr-like helicase